MNMSDPQGQTPSGHSAAGRETPDPSTSAAGSTAGSVADRPVADPGYADRSYRSVQGFAAGVLLIALALWLGADAVFRGHGREPAYGVVVLVLLLPLFFGFMIWPVVRANPDRLLVRNPFRTITAPWSSVESIQAALSVELRAGGNKYQAWAVPVSLRQRKRAGRRAMIAKGDDAVVRGSRSRPGADSGPGSRFPVGGPGLRSRAGTVGRGDAGDDVPRASADRAVEEIRELASQAVGRPTAVGPVTVTWTWGVIVPAALGAIALVVLIATN